MRKSTDANITNVPKRRQRKRTARQQRAQRSGSKIAKVVDMLRKPTGSTIKAIMRATGWQAHRVRGAISGAIKKRLRLNVTSKVRGDERIYRIGT